MFQMPSRNVLCKPHATSMTSVVDAEASIQSPQCQKAAWKQHKKVCREAPTLKSTSPDAPVAGVHVKGPIFHPKNITVAPDHPVWTKGTVSPISQLIGLPILIHRDEQEYELDMPNDESRCVYHSSAQSNRRPTTYPHVETFNRSHTL